MTHTNDFIIFAFLNKHMHASANKVGSHLVGRICSRTLLLESQKSVCFIRVVKQILT